MELASQVIQTANLAGSLSRKAGGLYQSVRRLVQSLSAMGLGVRVFGLEDDYTYEDLSAWGPVQVEVFRPIWPRAFGYAPGFLDGLSAYRPDLVHTHGLWMYPSVVANSYYRRSGAPYLVSPHGMLDPWALRNSRWRKAVAYIIYERAHLQDARCLRALCTTEAKALRALGLKNDIAVVPNGVDLPEDRDQGACGGNWRPGENNAQEEASGSLAGGRKMLLYLGRIHPKKGLMNLLRGWTDVQRTRGGEWVLVIAGWEQSGHEAELKALASELGLRWADIRGQKRGVAGCAERVGLRNTAAGVSVVFAGPLFGPEKEAAFRDCHAFVLPSLSEGLPMAVLEAWAYARPVLMTTECNLPEGFAAGAALRIEANRESIARGLEALLGAGDSALKAMGARGRVLVAERFTWEVVASEMARLYGWVLGGGEKPGCIEAGNSYRPGVWRS